MKPHRALLILVVLVAACADEPRPTLAQARTAGAATDSTWTIGSVLGADTALQIGEYITAIHEDRKGNVWFGTLTEGLCRYDGTSFTYLTARDDFGGRSVRGIVEDDRGVLWITTQDGLWRYDGTSFTSFTVDDGLADNRCGGITRDRHGTLWIGTNRGLSRYDGSTFSSLELPLDTSPKDYPTGNTSPLLVWRSLEDRSGNLWFATNGSGVVRYDGTAFTRLTTRDGLSSDFVFCIAEDRNGVLWFGTDRGLCRYDGATFTTYTEADGLAFREVYAMMVDRDGALWLGTGGGGASRFDGTTFTTVASAEGLRNPHVQSLLEDSRGRLWLGTSGGLYRYERGRAINVTRR